MRYDAMNHPLKEKIDWKGGFMNTPRCFNFYGGAILISKHQKLGTLLDLVNLTKNADKSVIEPIAIYLMAELLGNYSVQQRIQQIYKFLRRTFGLAPQI